MYSAFCSSRMVFSRPKSYCRGWLNLTPCVLLLSLSSACFILGIVLFCSSSKSIIIIFTIILFSSFFLHRFMVSTVPRFCSVYSVRSPLLLSSFSRLLVFPLASASVSFSLGASSDHGCTLWGSIDVPQSTNQSTSVGTLAKKKTRGTLCDLQHGLV